MRQVPSFQGAALSATIRAELADLPVDGAVEWRTTQDALAQAQRVLALLKDRLLANARGERGPIGMDDAGPELTAALLAFPSSVGPLFAPLELLTAARSQVGHDRRAHARRLLIHGQRRAFRIRVDDDSPERRRAHNGRERNVDRLRRLPRRKTNAPLLGLVAVE